MRRRWKQLLFVCAVILVWFGASSTGLWSAYVLPPPQKVAVTMLKLLRDGSLWRDISVSLRRVAIGFSIAFTLAFLIGVALAYSRKAREWCGGALEFLRNVPPISMISLFILWFGIGELPKIIVIVLASFFPMYLNIQEGIRGADRKLIEVGQALGFSKLQIFFRIVLQEALKTILTGMRIGLGYSYRAIIGAEMVAAASGLGHMIVYAQQMSRSDKVITGILLIGGLGILTDRLFLLLIRLIEKRRGEGIG